MGSCFFQHSFSKKKQYLVNGESNQKIVTSKKDAKLNFRPVPPHQTFKTCRIKAQTILVRICCFFTLIY